MLGTLYMKTAPNDKDNDFERAQNQLYILTGSKPDITTGSIHRDKKGKHLRFTGFPTIQDEQFNQIKAALYFFQFDFALPRNYCFVLHD